MFTQHENFLELNTPLKPITELNVALEDLSSYNQSIQTSVGHDEIALEVISFNDAVSYLKKLSSKVNLVNRLTKERVEFSPTVDVVKASSLVPSKKIMATNFAELRTTHIYKPTGLSGYYADLFTWMENYQELFSTLPKNVIVPFTRYLQGVINEPSEVRGFPSSFGKIEDPDAINKELGKLFKAPEGVDVGEMGKLLRRMKDIPENAERLEKLTTVFSAVGRDDILRSIDVTMVTLEDLMRVFNEEELRPSKAFIAAVANHVTKLAKLSAAYSLYVGKLVATTSAMKDNVQRFKDIESNIR